MAQREEPAAATHFADLAGLLGVLAHPLRVALVHRLGRPAFAPDLAAEFGITRQALKKHLDALVAADLVVARPARRGPLPATEYAASPSGLFAFKDSVLGLAVASDPAVVAPAVTRAAAGQPSAAGAGGAGLLLVHGEAPGRWFALARGPDWVLGRDAQADVPLTYDAFASARHALLRRGAAGWTLTDLGSRNGTRVNFRPLPANEAVPVAAGDLLTIGRSHLLLREGI